VKREGVDDMLEALARSGELAAFGNMAFPLEKYDREHNSDLVHTLRVFFEANANASEAADRLFLHRNSMVYRLERVQDLTGLDLKNPKVRLALQLGLLSLDNENTEEEGEGEDEAEHP
jgi:DNA-binding PucR family transcriptional regulator